MKPLKPRRITVLGDGGWGTTLAILLARRGHTVVLWGAFSEYLGEIARKRENRKFLPGVPIPAAVRAEPDIYRAVSRAELIIFAVPSQHLRAILKHLKGIIPGQVVLLNVAKGLERGTLKRMSEVIREELRLPFIATLSGPNIAREIATGHPASAVIASTEAAVAKKVQQWLASDHFRTYTSQDLVGVELGGALKNPLAIAAGIADGLGLGSNAKAALVTRGVVEMARLGAALGAQEGTFWGLSGLGDLVTTCLSGRNHWLGEQLGKGRSLKATLKSTPMVIEGVETCQAAVALARRCAVELPIIEQVNAVLFKKRPPRVALRILMRRGPKAENP